MAALPKSSTVIVHAIIDGRHSATVFPEVDIERSVDISNCTPFQTPTYGQTKYIITGSAGACSVEGGGIEEVGARIIAFQSEKAARLRKERDEARRERDAALQEMAVLKANLLRIIDPDSSDDDDDDYCEQCNDYHDWGEED